MRILLITDNFHPESNALANRSTTHTNFWKKKNKVIVITCFPNHPMGRKFQNYDKFKFFKKEKSGNLTVYRIWSFISKKNNSYINFFDYLSFGLTSFFFSFFIKCDLIIGSSPPLPVAFFTMLNAKLRNIKIVTEVRDLWVDSINDLKLSRSKTLINILYFFESLMFRNSNLIVCTTRSIQKKIIKRKVDKRKVLIRANGSSKLIHNKKQKISINNIYKKGKLNILYLGTIGVSQNFKIILDVIKRFKGKLNFIIIGNGSEVPLLKSQISSINSNDIKLIEMKENSLNHKIYNKFDLGITSLKNNKTFKTVIPSKIYDYASHGLTTLFIGPEGDASYLIKKYSLGIYSKPNLKDLTKKINILISRKKIFRKNAKKLMLRNKKLFDRKKVAKQMLDDFRIILK